AKYGDSVEVLTEKLKKIEEEDVSIHKIPVKNGYLRVIVEDGVPRITYMSDERNYLVEMISTNSLRFINF
ncbi:MAG: hypothetical protein ACRCZ0_09590, partial [Cetobacterium sp.]